MLFFEKSCENDAYSSHTLSLIDINNGNKNQPLTMEVCRLDQAEAESARVSTERK
jgi:hypothetical protein